MPIMSKQGLCHISSSVLPWLGGILLCWLSWYWTAFCLLRRNRTGSGVGLLYDTPHPPPLPKGGSVRRWSCLCRKCDGYEFVFSRMHTIRRGTLGAKCKRTFLFIHLQTKLWLSNLIQLSLSHCVYLRLCYNVFSLSDDDKRMVCDLCKGYFFSSLISRMISPDINFNKFLRICWRTLILAQGGGAYQHQKLHE